MFSALPQLGRAVAAVTGSHVVSAAWRLGRSSAVRAGEGTKHLRVVPSWHCESVRACATAQLDPAEILLSKGPWLWTPFLHSPIAIAVELPPWLLGVLQVAHEVFARVGCQPSCAVVSRPPAADPPSVAAPAGPAGPAGPGGLGDGRRSRHRRRPRWSPPQSPPISAGFLRSSSAKNRRPWHLTRSLDRKAGANNGHWAMGGARAASTSLWATAVVRRWAAGGAAGRCNCWRLASSWCPRPSPPAPCAAAPSPAPSRPSVAPAPAAAARGPAAESARCPRRRQGPRARGQRQAAASSTAPCGSAAPWRFRRTPLAAR